MMYVWANELTDYDHNDGSDENDMEARLDQGG
jgi:hypothetical protein